MFQLRPLAVGLIVLSQFADARNSSKNTGHPDEIKPTSKDGCRGHWLVVI